MAAAHSVYADEIVPATRLNRNTREVLDSAWERCVTIVRNEQAFALLRRDHAARMIAELAGTELALGLLQGALLLWSGRPLDATHPHEWLAAFDREDLADLVNEVYAAWGRARTGEIPWEEFHAVVHEWQESAWAARSPELSDAFAAEGDEVPLTAPDQPVIAAGE